MEERLVRILVRSNIEYEHLNDSLREAADIAFSTKLFYAELLIKAATNAKEASVRLQALRKMGTEWKNACNSLDVADEIAENAFRLEC